MVRRAQRLDRRAFSAVRASQLFCADKTASLSFVCTGKTSRFSVVVPKSIIAKAADRNRKRRVLYEALRTAGTQGIDAILWLRSNTTNSTLLQNVKKIILQASRRCQNPT